MRPDTLYPFYEVERDTLFLAATYYVFGRSLLLERKCVFSILGTRIFRGMCRAGKSEKGYMPCGEWGEEGMSFRMRWRGPALRMIM
jgi:hypothetical protein